MLYFVLVSRNIIIKHIEAPCYNVKKFKRYKYSLLGTAVEAEVWLIWRLFKQKRSQTDQNYNINDV